MANVATGNVFTAIPLHVTDSHLRMFAYHNSMSVISGLSRPASSGLTLGRGWSFTFSGSVYKLNATTAHVLEDDGTTNEFSLENGEWVAPPGVYDQLLAITNRPQQPDYWLLTRKDGSYRRFAFDSGKLLAIGDSSGHETTLIYREGPNCPCNSCSNPMVPAGALCQIVDAWPTTHNHTNAFLLFASSPQISTWRVAYGSGWGHSFSHTTEGNLESIEACRQTPFEWYHEAIFWHFTYTDEGRIVTLTDRDNHVWTVDGKTYEFDAIDPTPLAGGYPLSRHFNLWGEEQSMIRQHTVTDRRGHEWRFDFTNPQDVVQRALVGAADPLGNESFIQRNADFNVTAVTDPLGSTLGDPAHTSHFDWDSRGNLLSATNQLGYTTAFQYDSFDNLLRVFPPDDAGQVSTTPSVEIVYDDANNPRLPTQVIEQPAFEEDPPAVTEIRWYGPQDAASACPNANAWNGMLKQIIDPNGVTHDFMPYCYGLPFTEVEAAASPDALKYWVTYTPEGFLQNRYFGEPDFGPNSAIDPLVNKWEQMASGCPDGFTRSGGCNKSECGNTNTTSGLEENLAVTCQSLTGLHRPHGCPTMTYTNEGRCTAEQNSLCQFAAWGQGFPRSRTYAYNELGLLTRETLFMNWEPLMQTAVTPPSVTRELNYTYDLAAGKMSRKLPNSTTTDVAVEFDIRGLPESVSRNGVTTAYEYYPDGKVHRVTHSNGPRVEYTYDNARRLTDTLHLRRSGATFVPILWQAYTYKPNGLLESVEDRFYDSQGSPPAECAIQTRFFSYDARGRLYREQFFSSFISQNCSASAFPPGFDGADYCVQYTYDLGGNRLTKTVADAAGCTDIREYTEYSYDIYDENADSKANRLTEYQVFAEPNGQPLRSAKYEYDAFGNVTRIIKHESASNVEKVTFMSYAYNTLPWLVVDEDWSIDPQGCQRTKVREIRYDHGRRYMVQSTALNPPLNPPAPPGDAVWTEFDGGAPVRDISIPTNGGGAVSDIRQQSLGAWQYDSGSAQTHFFHTDHLGTTQIMTNAAGQIIQYQSFTAFGEPADGWPFASLTQPSTPLSRYGIAGAHGYEGLPPPHADQNFPYLHLGARYYDPEIGRFLQRDPIGIAGGLNTYVYAFNNPIAYVDPSGCGVGSWVLNLGGAVVSGAAVGSGLGLIVGQPAAGAVGGAVAGGLSYLGLSVFHWAQGWAQPTWWPSCGAGALGGLSGGPGGAAAAAGMSARAVSAWSALGGAASGGISAGASSNWKPGTIFFGATVGAFFSGAGGYTASFADDFQGGIYSGVFGADADNIGRLIPYLTP